MFAYNGNLFYTKRIHIIINVLYVSVQSLFYNVILKCESRSFNSFLLFVSESKKERKILKTNKSAQCHSELKNTEQ